MACLDDCSHLEGAGGVEGVDQQPPAPGVRGQSAHWATLMTVNLRRQNIMHYIVNENHDIAIAMSSSRADPLLGLNIPSFCPVWGYLNI